MGAEFQKGLLLFHQGRYREAAERFKLDAFDDFCGHSARSMYALSLLNDNNHTAARTAIRDALAQSPDDAHAHYVLAHVCLREPSPRRRMFSLHRSNAAKGKLTGSYDALQTAIRLEPHNAGFREFLSILEAARGRWDLSLEAAEMGLALNPSHTGCANRRAIALRKLGEFDESDNQLKEALTIDPENAATHTHRGWLELQRRRPDEAREHFRTALRKNPNLKNAELGLKIAKFARVPVLGWLISLGIWSNVGRRWPFVAISYFSLRAVQTYWSEQMHLSVPMLFLVFLVQTTSVIVLLMLIVKFVNQIKAWRIRRRLNFNGRRTTIRFSGDEQA